MTRRTNARCGQNTLFEYACSDSSIIGQRSEDVGVKCIRLTRSVLDRCNAEHVKQAIAQLESLPGADTWISITCTHFSPLQRLNLAQHGSKFKRRLKANQEETKLMLGYAMQFAEICASNNGRIAFELPQEAGIWELAEWVEFEKRMNLKRAYCNGCAFGLTGKEGLLLRKPWCIATNDLRMLQFVNQHRCDGTHSHGESMAGNANMTGFYILHHLQICFFKHGTHRLGSSMYLDWLS